MLYTDTSVIYEGMPLCYDYDSTTNIDGYDIVDGVGATTDESHQNEGKYIRVTDPEDNALMHFAGVVAGVDKEGKTGDGATWLDIYIPNGATVPVRCDVDTTAGITLLAITVDSQEFGLCVAGTSRIVALAMETETALDGTAGITLARLDTAMSVYQNLDGTALSVGAGTGDIVANSINLTSAQTAGRFTAFEVIAEVSAGGNSNGYGIAGYFQTDITGTPVIHCPGVGMWINLTGGTPLENIHVLEIGLYEDGATLTNVGLLDILSLTHQVADAPKANNFNWISLVEDGAEHADNFITIKELVDFPATAFTGAYTIGTSDYGIKVYVSGSTTTYYIPLCAALA